MRLYGRGAGFGSHARVTAGFLKVLAGAERLAGFCDFDDLQASEAGSTARVAVFTGPLNLLWRMRFNAQHQQRWVMVAPNSTEIGSKLEKEIEEFATHLMAPSRWAADVLGKRFNLPIAVVPHGIESEFCVAPRVAALDDPEQLTVLHLSSSDRQRKGTEELVEAWRQAKPMLPRYAKLVLVVESTSLLLWRRKLQPEWGIFARRRFGGMAEGLPAREMAQLYRSVHGVVQPSRGEAFGLVPLEARCCGTPVIATLCTGHSEHMAPDTPGVVTVATGELEPIDDLPGALAPSLRVESLVLALVELGGHWRSLSEASREHAPIVRSGWSWERQLAPWVEAL